MISIDCEESAWKPRLDTFFAAHSDQLVEKDARLIFRVRSGDLLNSIDDYVSANGICASIIAVPGTTHGEEKGFLCEQSAKAIFKRAKEVFEYNQHPTPCIRSGPDIQSVGLREGDRLAVLPDGRILEQALVGLAAEMKSIYSVQGAYGAVQVPFPNLEEFLKNVFNGYCWDVPFPVIDALFRKKEFEMRTVYDGIPESADKQVPKAPQLFDLATGDFAVIVACAELDEKYGGYKPKPGTGFKITHSDCVVPVKVTQESQDLKFPVVCAPTNREQAQRYEIRATQKGKLYVAEYMRYGGGKWMGFGLWGNTAEVIPDDTVAYMILKPARKAH